jgi:hypothetical protein
MRAPMLRLFIAATFLLFSIPSTRLGQDHNPHGSLFSDENHDEHEHLAAKVWVNTKSGKYFYPGSHWYGKIKNSRYMSEKEARAKGDKMAQGNELASGFAVDEGSAGFAKRVGKLLASASSRSTAR